MEVKSQIEALGLPALALAGAVLSIVMLGVTVASGGTALLAMSVVAAAAGFGFAAYRFGKYIQSENALADLLKTGQIVLSESDKEQLKACIAKSHSLYGNLRDRITGGATLGDYFRLKLAQMLLNAYHNDRLDLENEPVHSGASSPLFDAHNRLRQYLAVARNTQAGSPTIPTAEQNLALTAEVNLASMIMREMLVGAVWEVIKTDVAELDWRRAMQNLPQLNYTDKVKTFFQLIRKNK